MLLYLLLAISVLINIIYTYDHFKRNRVNIVTESRNSNIKSSSIVFIGNSMFAKFPLNKMMPGHDLVNSGIAGERTIDICSRIVDIIRHRPKAVFVMAGTNDILYGVSLAASLDNYRKLITSCNGIPLYVLSLLPMTYEKSRFNAQISTFNDSLIGLCKEQHVTFLPVNRSFTVNNEVLDPAYYHDGVHLNMEGYNILAEQLKPILDRVDIQQ